MFVLIFGPNSVGTGTVMKKVFTMLLALVVAMVPLVQVAQGQTQSTEAVRIAKVKSEVTKRLANKKERVKLKLHDGTEVKGRLEQANDGGFTLTEDKTNKKIDLAYSVVDKVNGRGMSTLTKVGIGAAIAVGVLAILVVVALKNFDPFSGGIVAR
jgi:hypothetical protein